MKELVAKIENLLRLRSIPFGMKLYESVAEMEAIPKIRRPKGSVHTLDQVVAQAARLGWTVGITTDDLVGDQCRSVVGLGAQDEKWYSGRHMVGVWFATPVDAAAHQRAMNVVPVGKYKALAVAPLASGRLDPPDIALFYATPGAMMYFINGLQWSGYKRFDWSVVGESACADSWGRAHRLPPGRRAPVGAPARRGGPSWSQRREGHPARRAPVRLICRLGECPLSTHGGHSGDGAQWVAISHSRTTGEDIMRSIRLGVIFASCIVAATVCVAAISYDMPARKEMKRADLSGAPGMEVISSISEYKKGAEVPRHLHHGVETGYVLQGTMVQLPGKEPIMMETGAPILNLRDVPHAGFKVVGDQPLKVFTVHIVDKGKPLYDWVK